MVAEQKQNIEEQSKIVSVAASKQHMHEPPAQAKMMMSENAQTTSLEKVPAKVETKNLSQEPNYGSKKNDNIMRGEGTLIQGGQDPTSTT